MPLRLAAPRHTLDDDRGLLARFAADRDQAAFAALVGRHGPLVLGVCRRVLRDPHLADDAFQATFLVLANKAAAVRIDGSAASYLFGVARRVALAARRREMRMRNAERGVRNEKKAVPSPDVDELRRILDDELARLPDKLRAPVLECFLREKTQDEAAKALGWSLSTVRRRLDRAKELLRARLTARGVALGGALTVAALLASSARAEVPAALAAQAVAAATGSASASVAALAAGGFAWAKLGLAVGVAVAAGVVGVGFARGWWASAPPVAVPVVEPIVNEGPEVAPPPREVVVPRAAEVPKVVEPPVPVPPEPPPSKSAEPMPPAAGWGTIAGHIIMSKPPEKRPVMATNDKSHCEQNGALSYEDMVVNPKGGGVKNVVVWLRPDTDNRKDVIPPDRVRRSEPRHHVIDQPCCQFEPRVVAARAGDTLEVKNSAPVPHNINMAADSPGFTFNVTVPPGKSYKPEWKLDAQSSPIPFKCDIHQWMQGRIRVFDHPYFAVTDADGKFTIPDAPPGKWRLVVWHENGYHKGRDGLLGWPVEVKADGVTSFPTVDLELPK